jgi:NADH dehydrogenase (ubiquinone) 1 beta subcomplex subunit 8
MGVFSLEEYRHFKPGRAGALVGAFVVTFLGFTGVVYMFYPDRPSVPRTFPGGLDIELGGKGAVPVSSRGQSRAPLMALQALADED